MDLGSTIKALRIKKGINQKEFAKLCDITPTYLSQIESNQKEPTIAKLKIIAEALQIPLPIVFFLSIEDSDIKPERRNAFHILGPSVKSMVGEFFTNSLGI